MGRLSNFDGFNNVGKSNSHQFKNTEWPEAEFLLESNMLTEFFQKISSWFVGKYASLKSQVESFKSEFLKWVQTNPKEWTDLINHLKNPSNSSDVNIVKSVAEKNPIKLAETVETQIGVLKENSEQLTETEPQKVNKIKKIVDAACKIFFGGVIAIWVSVAVIAFIVWIGIKATLVITGVFLLVFVGAALCFICTAAILYLAHGNYLGFELFPDKVAGRTDKPVSTEPLKRSNGKIPRFWGKWNFFKMMGEKGANKDERYKSVYDIGSGLEKFLSSVKTSEDFKSITQNGEYINLVRSWDDTLIKTGLHFWLENRGEETVEGTNLYNLL